MKRSYIRHALLPMVAFAGLSLSACVVETDDIIGLDSLELVSAPETDVTVASAPQVYRNTDSYDLSQPGRPLTILVVSTYPASPFAPVYSWRTHTQHTGPGQYGYSGKLIGYTDSQGVYQFIARLPNDASFCGSYTDEQFAVGSKYAPRSGGIDFQIYRGVDVGPRDPDCYGYW